VLILHKLLPMLVAPLFVFVMLAMVGLALRRRRLGIAALVLLWILSLPIVADVLWRRLEYEAVRPVVASAPRVAAIVVLGGMTRIVQGEQGAVRVWADGSDRFWAGLELFKTGRASKLIFTGGQLPWCIATQTEGQWLCEQAQAVGVQKADIMVTSSVTNTLEEAQAVSQLLPGKTVLLVTSAFHMPRALAIFQAAGLQVYPFPVDQRVGKRDMTLMDFMPSAKALDRTTDAFREWLGRGFYAVKHLLTYKRQLADSNRRKSYLPWG
jgi:uncharacterized SAM-binding protein YcdF (DUF218 family)